MKTRPNVMFFSAFRASCPAEEVLALRSWFARRMGIDNFDSLPWGGFITRIPSSSLDIKQQPAADIHTAEGLNGFESNERLRSAGKMIRLSN